ncbi:MAG: hypothetical protein P8184_19110 [Calditrichia bacterium]
MQFPIGVANSVSSNFGYDPLDAMHYAKQSGFSIVQIYVNEKMLQDSKGLENLKKELAAQHFSTIYLHAEGDLNPEFLGKDYSKALFSFVEFLEECRLVLHFDETAALEDMLDVLNRLVRKDIIVYLENYFQSSGQENAEKNMRKYQALFTLANSHTVQLHPVLDIPRFFQHDLKMSESDALEWCYQMFNYFGNRRIPILLHLIDATDSRLERNSFCALGEGFLPYEKIFSFLLKNRTLIEGVILEYEDKINPLKSREYLKSLWDKHSGR